MNSQDDPEERIRELERPLADAARASESGQAPPPGGYPYAPGPPPPPPPAGPWTYGGPSYGSPPRSSSGNRTWWIVGTFIVIGFLALAGGIAAFAAHQLSGVRSIISSPPSISATFGPPPSATSGPGSPGPSSTRTRTTSPSASPTPSPGARLSVSGIGENRSIACNDNIVSVSGVSNTVVITGHCTSLTVSGVQNAITVDAVDSIDASGFNNKVTYHSGNPKISNAGGSNVVQQG
ncbi:DUF3060 domain-containing protein [Mycobacterium sp.]|uniref:DUF3060 domain-containing protein n=1 Tax=Mycobacterium sp. TaxID=1785 RepID=UPI002CCB4D5A|nr:DUF3060 domain-containing protein [Mycobacterium sp.]HTY34535.1 DUF3060 domain-containing protein [Mycobacterium sp.]